MGLIYFSNHDSNMFICPINFSGSCRRGLEIHPLRTPWFFLNEYLRLSIEELGVSPFYILIRLFQMNCGINVIRSNIYYLLIIIYTASYFSVFELVQKQPFYSDYSLSDRRLKIKTCRCRNNTIRYTSLKSFFSSIRSECYCLSYISTICFKKRSFSFNVRI